MSEGNTTDLSCVGPLSLDVIGWDQKQMTYINQLRTQIEALKCCGNCSGFGKSNGHLSFGIHKYCVKLGKDTESNDVCGEWMQVTQ